MCFKNLNNKNGQVGEEKIFPTTITTLVNRRSSTPRSAIHPHFEALPTLAVTSLRTSGRGSA